MREIRVEKNDAGQRLDKFLIKALGIPVSLLYKYLRKKRIRLDGARAKGNEMIAEGQTLTLYINDEFFEKKPERKGVSGALEIVYEDENIALLSKPAGLLCHAPEGEDSLWGRFLGRLIETGEYVPGQERSFVPALCNRLDRNTAGLVLAAKTAAALREGDAFLRERKIRKFYLCLTEKAPSPAQGEMRGYIRKKEAGNKAEILPQSAPGAVEYRMGYRTVEKKGSGALVEIELHTGRSHQIRAAFAYHGYPLVGDRKYGAATGGGQQLFAYKMIFDFPPCEGAFERVAGKTFCLPFPKFAKDANFS